MELWPSALRGDWLTPAGSVYDKVSSWPGWRVRPSSSRRPVEGSGVTTRSERPRTVRMSLSVTFTRQRRGCCEGNRRRRRPGNCCRYRRITPWSMRGPRRGGSPGIRPDRCPGNDAPIFYGATMTPMDAITEGVWDRMMAGNIKGVW